MDSTWEELFTVLDAFEDEQVQQKQRGLNDFNLLSSVLSVNDGFELLTYERAKRQNPRRWSGNTRNWEVTGPVSLNPSKLQKVELNKLAA
jgi:hypothetical protein